MAGETVITVIGNLTSDPELRYTSSSVPVASFTVASTPRTFNRASGQWEEGTAMFLRCSAWREMAENINESLRKGMRVIVSGRLVQRNWEKEGQSRSSLELQVDEIGPSLRYAQASVTRNNRGNIGEGGYSNQGSSFSGNSGGFSQESSFGGGSFGGPQGGSSNDPWATGDSFSSSFDDNPAY